MVNEDGHGGSAPHPTVWDLGRQPQRRRVLQAVREFAWILGPVGLWKHGSVGWPVIHVGDADLAAWPYSPSMLGKLWAFLSSLHWPTVVDDLEVSGVSYIELLILYERWAGERLVLEPAVPEAMRDGRLISVSAVPAGPNIDIWRSYWVLGSFAESSGSFAWWSWTLYPLSHWR